MPGKRPTYKLLATDNSGTQREIAAIWETSKPDVFGGKLDLENTGDPISFVMVRADRPKLKAQSAPGLQPAA